MIGPPLLNGLGNFNNCRNSKNKFSSSSSSVVVDSPTFFESFEDSKCKEDTKAGVAITEVPALVFLFKDILLTSDINF